MTSELFLPLRFFHWETRVEMLQLVSLTIHVFFSLLVLPLQRVTLIIQFANYFAPLGSPVRLHCMSTSHVIG